MEGGGDRDDCYKGKLDARWRPTRERRVLEGDEGREMTEIARATASEHRRCWKQNNMFVCKG